MPILGAGAVMGGVAQVSATIEGPGVVRQTGTFMKLMFGELAGGRSARGDAFLALCQKAGFDAEHSDKIFTELWLKFIVLATNSAITAATRTPFGKLREDPECRSVSGGDEGGRCGRPGKGIPLPEDAARAEHAFIAGAPPAMMASMAHDLIRATGSSCRGCPARSWRWGGNLACRRRCIRCCIRY